MGWIKKIFGMSENMPKNDTYTHKDIKGGVEVFYNEEPTGYQIMKSKKGFYIHKNHKRVKNPILFSTLKSAEVGVLILHQDIVGIVEIE